MRSDLLAYLKTLSLGTYSISDELPWSQSGTPLYLINLRKIYVDADQVDQSVLYETLNTLSGTQVRSVTTETRTVRVYFVNDAKVLPSNYDAVVGALMTARVQDYTAGYTDRTVNVSTSFAEDRLITTLEFRFTKITN